MRWMDGLKEMVDGLAYCKEIGEKVEEVEGQEYGMAGCRRHNREEMDEVDGWISRGGDRDGEWRRDEGYGLDGGLGRGDKDGDA